MKIGVHLVNSDSLFESFGFRREAWGELVEALLAHAREGEVVEQEETPFGTQYLI